MHTSSIFRTKVLLTPQLAAEIKRASNLQGISVNKLVAHWLAKSRWTDLLAGERLVHKRSVLLELRLNSVQKDLLDDLAQQLGLTASSTLLRVITHGLVASASTSGTSVQNAIMDMWQRGEFSMLDTLNIESTTALKPDILYTLTRSSIEAGRLSEAEFYLQEFDRVYGGEDIYLVEKGFMAICRSRLARINKDLAATEAHALLALDISTRLQNSQLRGLAEFRLGVHKFGEGNALDSTLHFEKAAAHLNLQSEPYIFLQIYLSKAAIACFEFDEATYTAYMNLARQVLHEFPNTYFDAYYYSVLLQHEYLVGNKVKNLHTDMRMGLALAQNSGSTLMMYDMYELLGVMSTTGGNVDAADKDLSLAQAYEKAFRPDIKTSHIELFQLINHIPDGYSHYRPILQRLADKFYRQGLLPEVYAYIFNAVDYIHASEGSVLNESYQHLNKLQAESKLPHIQKAATITINTKQLAPVL